MPVDRIHRVLSSELDDQRKKGTLKGKETVFTRVLPPAGGRGPRFHLEGEGENPFIKMNSNSYLGMSLRPEIIQAEEEASRAYGTGPGAVRFISGTFRPHVELEKRLAVFHSREAGMIFSAAYTAIMGVLPPLITNQTAVISDALNHSCIINSVRLSRPKEKHIYKHLDMKELEARLEQAAVSCRRAIVVTDGIFSMRGDYAPLDEVVGICRRHDEKFSENVLVVADDSHGVGAFGKTGRGVEEYSGSEPVDLLVATLGKALGINGGYVVGSDVIIEFLREKSPFYIYSNPITPAEAAAALKSLEILDSPRGRELLDHLRKMTARFEQGLVRLGYETIPGEHPVVPLMVRHTAKTSALVKHLFDNGVLATGLNFPVVPKGDEEIRFQVNSDHTPGDIDAVLDVLKSFPGRA